MRLPHRRRQPAKPRPPQNVRLVYPNGSIIPVECRYDGQQDGIHVWVAVVPEVAPLVGGMEICCDLLPAHTTVGICVWEDD